MEFGYLRLREAEKGVIRRYIQKMTGYSPCQSQRAEQLARLAGVTLGTPTSISRDTVHFPPKREIWPMAALPAPAAAFVTPILPGEQEIVINVQVIFAIG